MQRFARQSKEFWAQVKLISMQVGYSERPRRGEAKKLRRFSESSVVECYRERGLSVDHLVDQNGLTAEGALIVEYLNERARIVEEEIRPNLMNREQAKNIFEEIKSQSPSAKCSLPMNKQKGDKRHHAYLTCIVNLLTEDALGDYTFVDNPRVPITITDSRRPSRTLSRWMDGAYPSLNNPIACWEIKEYYGTTTFGSRVADGVYESMLDGLELEELKENTNFNVLHYLIVDDYFTWWEKGRSYLCRLVDMVNSGLVDEVLFGREVVEKWPAIVKSWPRL